MFGRGDRMLDTIVLYKSILVCSKDQCLCTNRVHINFAYLMLLILQMIVLTVFCAHVLLLSMLSYSTVVLYNYRDHEGLEFLDPKYHPKTSLIFTL